MQGNAKQEYQKDMEMFCAKSLRVPLLNTTGCTKQCRKGTKGGRSTENAGGGKKSHRDSLESLMTPSEHSMHRFVSAVYHVLNYLATKVLQVGKHSSISCCVCLGERAGDLCRLHQEVS